MMITKELAEILNPEGLKLTQAQWQAKFKKYQDAQALKEQRSQEVGERPGVCGCGSKQFFLKVIAGTGKIERTCKKCENIKIV